MFVLAEIWQLHPRKLFEPRPADELVSGIICVTCFGLFHWSREAPRHFTPPSKFLLDTDTDGLLFIIAPIKVSIFSVETVKLCVFGDFVVGAH